MKKARICTISWCVGALFTLFSFIFVSIDFAMQLNYNHFNSYDAWGKSVVVLSMLLPMISIIINLTCGIIMFIDASVYQNEETIKGLGLESIIVMPIFFVFTIVSFFYWWVYIITLFVAAVGFHVFYKTIKIAFEIQPKKEAIVLETIEN